MVAGPDPEGQEPPDIAYPVTVTLRDGDLRTRVEEIVAGGEGGMLALGLSYILVPMFALFYVVLAPLVGMLLREGRVA